jgi:mannitol/fructose-specific phosphotransferase system IIA component (Ntr-type)
MALTDILTPARIKLPLEAATRDGVIEELIDLLDADGCLSNRQGALQAVLAREATRSTAIGSRLAFPHGKTPAVDRLVLAIGRSPEPIPFASPDGRGVTLIALLLSPLDKTGPHIQALARLSRMLSMDMLRAKIAHAATGEELYHLLEEHERRPV